MKDCLVLKICTSLNNPSLTKFGEIKITVTDGGTLDGGDYYFYFHKLTSEPITVELSDPTKRIMDNKQNVLGNPYTGIFSNNLCDAGNYILSARKLYTFEKFHIGTKMYCNFSDLAYATNLTEIFHNGNNNNTGNLADLGRLSKLTNISVANWGLMRYELVDFVKAQYKYGRTSCNGITLGVYTPCLFNGILYIKNSSDSYVEKLLTWTSDGVITLTLKNDTTGSPEVYTYSFNPSLI